MNFGKSLVTGLRGLFRKEDAEKELADELTDYLDKSVAEKMRRGMTREEATRSARLEMGGVEGVKENVRAASWETHVENLWNDLRFGLRLLRFNWCSPGRRFFPWLWALAQIRRYSNCLMPCACGHCR